MNNSLSPSDPTFMTVRPTLGPAVMRCLGADCVERDLCARYRDSAAMTAGVTKCVTSLLGDQAYPCRYLISTRMI